MNARYMIFDIQSFLQKNLYPLFNRFAQSARPEVKKSVLENMENKQRGNKQLNQQKNTNNRRTNNENLPNHQQKTFKK